MVLRGFFLCSPGQSFVHWIQLFCFIQFTLSYSEGSRELLSCSAQQLIMLSGTKRVRLQRKTLLKGIIQIWSTDIVIMYNNTSCRFPFNVKLRKCHFSCLWNLCVCVHARVCVCACAYMCMHETCGSKTLKWLFFWIWAKELIIVFGFFFFNIWNHSVVRSLLGISGEGC